jgi:hypothetical protein
VLNKKKTQPLLEIIDEDLSACMRQIFSDKYKKKPKKNNHFLEIIDEDLSACMR